MKEAILIKPLDGREIGETAEFSDADFERLERLGAVKLAKKAAVEHANKEAPKPANKAGGKKGG